MSLENRVTNPDGSITAVPVASYPVRRHEILLFRVFDVRGEQGGEGTARPAAFSVLADRLWPRGISKEDLQPDLWEKQLCPSKELREEFHDGLSFDEFSQRYRSELDQRAANGELADAMTTLSKTAGQGNIALLFAGKDTEHTHARVLAQLLVEAVSADADS